MISKMKADFNEFDDDKVPGGLVTKPKQLYPKEPIR